MKNSLIITNKEQLALLLSNSNFDEIEVNLKIFNKDYNKYWTEKIEKAYNACGCKIGYRFMVSGLIISMLYITFSINLIMDEPFIYTAIFFTFIIIMAVFGKGLGLLIAKLKLRKYIHEIKLLTK